MDQNWNNDAFGSAMPAPNAGMGPNPVSNNGADMNRPQMSSDSLVPPMPEGPTMQAPQVPQQGANMQAMNVPYGQPMPQRAPQVAPPNMNMGGSAPVVNQPGVSVPVQMKVKSEKGTLIETIILVAVCLVAAVAIIVAVVFFMKYNEVKEDQEAKIDAAVAEAVANEQDIAAKNLEEKLKLPNVEFRGPDDYGSISFQYPKTWSVYVDKDASNNSDFVAYFNPNKVPSLKDDSSRYALRFAIYNRQYDDVVKPYNTDVKNGKLRSKIFTADSNEISGLRFDGQIASKIDGTFVIFKVNDKTAILQTDSTVFLEDYEKILTTLRRGSN